MNFILDENNNPVQCPELLEWAEWFEHNQNRILLQHFIRDGKSEQEVKVSTIFLGIDLDFAMTGKPVLWETMIFGGKGDGFQNRYTSFEKAKEGHRVALALAAAGMIDTDEDDKESEEDEHGRQDKSPEALQQ